VNDARGDPLVLVAAALSSRVGILLDHERADFIFHDTPPDLLRALDELMTDEQRSRIMPTARTLRAERGSASDSNIARNRRR
jgi:hypothetical protein